MVDYVDIDEVEVEKIEATVITCPNCGENHLQLTGTDPEYYLSNLKNGRYDVDIEENLNRFEEEYLNKDHVEYCTECGHLFPADKYDLWEEKEIEALKCPVCDIVVPKVTSNRNNIGYICSSCGTNLEYNDWPHHGSGNVDVRATTDYFHGICPNCIDEENDEYSMMVLGDKVWVENSGRVVISLVCKRCGYRDAVKIKNHENKKPFILNEKDL